MLRNLAPRRLRDAALAAAAALLCGGFFEETGFEYLIPYVPTPDHIVERMLELAEVGENDFLLDLGSGDGRIPITAARKYGARGLGVEIQPSLVRLANENAAKAGVSHKVSFRMQDLFQTAFGEATVVALYLPPAVNMQLRPRLLQELRPGSRIVSHAFNMGGWLADVRENIRGVDVYLWIVPADVAGQWDVDDGARRFRLTIEQRFQEIRGSAVIGGRTVPMRDARLRGDRLDFALYLDGRTPTVFSGRVDGGAMQARAGTPAWTAKRVAPAGK